MIRAAALAAAALLSASSAGAEPSCLARVNATIRALRPSFARLGDRPVRLETFESRVDYFQARPLRAWRPAAQRAYLVRVNARVCADPPPEGAERAILAHELAHLDAYAGMRRRDLLLLGLAYLLRPGGARVESFEKAADDAVSHLGLAAELAAYRDWLFARLTPAQVARKRRLYRTPEELRSKLAKMTP